ncbi:MAG TPA: TolC family protein [Bacteroidia bacterium]|nr:TolC family protein [Bacteroidia bacterium]
MKTHLIYILLNLAGLLKAQLPSALTYTLFMNNVKTFHPYVKLANAVGRIGEESLQAARGNYDPNLSGSYATKFYDGKNYYNVFESEIKQAIFTSQSLKAGFEYGAGQYLNPSDYTPGNGLAYIGIEASLLQGLVLDKRRADVLKARHYLKISEQEKRHLGNTVLFESACTYSDWLLKHGVYKANRYFAALAQSRLEGIKALSLSGERPALDTTETAMLLQQRVLDFQQAHIEFQKQSAQVAINNWMNDEAGSFDATLVPADSLEQLLEHVSKKLLSTQANDGINNPLVLQYRSKLDLLNVERRFRAEMVKPVLNFNYNILSLPVNSGEFPSLSANNYKWGARLAFPLFLRNSRAELSIARLKMNAMQFEYDLKQTEIQNKLKFTASSLNVLAVQLQTAARHVDYSKRMLEAEKIRFEHGESSVFLINARENKWLEAELKRLDTMNKYIKTVFDYLYLKGSMDVL